MTGGEQLRRIRERLGLTIRDVEARSMRIAEKYGQQDYTISLSRLSDIETKDITPNIYKLYSFSVIYRRDLDELLALYGIESRRAGEDADTFDIPKTHLVANIDEGLRLQMPVKIDPGFDPRTTVAVGRMIAHWGTMPLAELRKFQSREFSYGYIGTEDFTMAPLLLPGSFVQVDESRRRIEEGPWRSEYERPIYFLETREGFACGWCELNGSMLVLRPHPMSPARTRMYRNGSEVEVLGQVVGIAMRLGGWNENGSAPPGKDSLKQS